MRKLIFGILVLISFTICFGIEANISFSLKKAQVENDFNKIISYIEKYHPKPYKAISKEEFEKAKDDFRNRMYDGMKRSEAILLFMEFISKINDSHTLINSYSDIRSIFPKFFIDKNLNTVTVNDGDIPYGSEIISIENVPIKELNEKLLTYVSGDTRNQKIARLYLDSYGELLGYIFFDKKGVNIEYKIGDKEQKEFIPFYRWRQREFDNSYYILEDENIMVLHLDHMLVSDKSEYNKFLDGMFDEAKQKGIKRLIIDFRKNAGGNYNYTEELLKRLTTKSVVLSEQNEIKISKERFIENLHKIKIFPLDFIKFLSKKIKKEIKDAYFEDDYQKVLIGLSYSKTEIETGISIILKNEGKNEEEIKTKLVELDNEKKINKDDFLNNYCFVDKGIQSSWIGWLFQKNITTESAVYFEKNLIGKIKGGYINNEILENLAGEIECTKEEIANLMRNEFVAQGKNTEEIESIIAKLDKENKINIKYFCLEELGDNIKRNIFDGKTILLIGGYTNSAAVHFSNAYKDLKIGKVIGEDTGGLTEVLGDMQLIDLPNCGINFGMPISRLFNETIASNVVKPDYTIENTIEAAKSREDIQVKKAIEMLKK